MFKLDLKSDQGFTIVDQQTGEEIELVYQSSVSRAGEPIPGKAKILIAADERYVILREGQTLDDKLATMRRRTESVGSFDDDYDDEYEDRPGHFDYMLDG